MSDIRLIKPEFLHPTVTVAVISDPFKFMTGDKSVVKTKTITYIPNSTMNSYLREFYEGVHSDYDYALSVNGKVVQEHDIPFVKPVPGDFIAVCPTVRGGGGRGGKNPIAMVAMLAVMIVAPQFGAWAVGLDAVEGAAIAMGMSYEVAVAAAGGIFSMAMGAVISAVFSPSVPNVDGYSGYDLGKDSATYGWDVRGNPVDQDKPVPVPYGEMVVQPPCVGRYISIDGNKQYLNVLLLIGEGEVDDITDMQINGNPIGTYQDVTWEIRKGTNNQTLIPNFSDTYFDNAVDVKLGTTFFTATTSSNAITRFGVGITFKGGLYYGNNSGGLDPRTVVVEIEYRKQGTSTWVVMSGSPFTITENPATKNALRKYFSSPELEAGAYEIRVRRTTETSTEARVADGCWFDYVQEIIPDDFVYPNRAMWAVKALATDQLSGGMPTFKCKVTRNYVDVWNPHSIQWEKKLCTKPCWAAYDILRHPRYGGSVAPERILFQEFLDWEDWIDTKGLTCNIYFDAQMSIPDALNHIGISGRASVVPKGYNYGVIVDRPTSPVGMYTVGNILKDSFEMDYLELKDRANVIEIVYFDKVKDYSRQSFEVVASDFNELETEIKKATYTLYATNNRQEAVNYARFMLNCNYHLRRVVSWKADIDAITHQTGDVVWLQHHVPYWGDGGRIVSSTMHSITFPFDVTLDGTNYNIDTNYHEGDVVLWMGVMYRCLKYAEAPAPYPTDLQWWSPAVYGLLLRHHPEAEEWESDTLYEDMDYVEYGDYLYVSVRNDNLNNVPDASGSVWWQLVCDRFEEKVITNTPGTYRTLNVSTPFKKLPQSTDLFSFGVIGKEAKKFRILTITKDQNLQAQLTGLEYRDEVYESDQILPPYPSETSLVMVANLRANETWLIVNGLGASMVELTWLGYVSHWKVFQRVYPSGQWLEIGDTSNSRFEIYNLTPGTSYEFAVVPFSAATPDAGQKAIVNFVGHPPTPSLVQGLGIATNKLGFILNWDLDPTPWVLGYDIADTTQVLESNYSGNNYLVKQSMQTGTYTFKVRARDVFGQVGEWVSIAHNVDGPSQITGITAVNIDEEVMLYWPTPAAGSLPVTSFEVKRGASWASGVSVGIVSSPYARVSELQGGNMTYWIAAIDSEGNYGAPNSITVTVAGPSGYLLHTLMTSDFHTGTPTNLCMKGPEGVVVANFSEFHHQLLLEKNQDKRILQESGYQILLEGSGVVLGDKISTIQDTLVDGELVLENGDGFYLGGGDRWELPETLPVHLENGVDILQDEEGNNLEWSGGVPVIPVSGGYEEEFDIGAIVTNSKISLNYSIQMFNSGVVVGTFISTKVSEGDAWSEETPGTVAMKAQFRYVKIRFAFTSDTWGYAYLNGFDFRVEAKEISDHGVGEVLAGQTYADVPLNKTFVSVENVIATPMGTTAKFCVAADPSINPTTIRIYMFDGVTGEPTYGTFSWDAKGYQ